MRDAYLFGPTCILSWDADPLVMVMEPRTHYFRELRTINRIFANIAARKENLSDSPIPAIEKFCLDLFISRDRSMAEGTVPGQLTTPTSGYFTITFALQAALPMYLDL